MLTGRYSEILRVIGRLLDEREALVKAEATDLSDWHDLAPEEEPLNLGYADIEIVEHESFVRVSWRSINGSTARQAYTDLSLSLLHARSRQLRGEASSDPSGEREELFRTLGQELDAEELQVSGIFEKEDEFFVSGSASGRYFNRSYTRDELLTLNHFRQSLRPDDEGEESRTAIGELEAAPPRRAQWLLWGD
jgi:hypothetical protein